MIRYIIDGHNVLHSIPKYLALLDRDYPSSLETLYTDILSYTYSKKVKIVLIFDGNPPWKPPEKTDHLTVFFSGDKKDGDTATIQQAKKWKGRQTIIVTEDRNLHRQVVAFGCQTITPAEFFRMITGKKRSSRNTASSRSQKLSGLTKAEVQWWKAEMEKEIANKKDNKS